MTTLSDGLRAAGVVLATVCGALLAAELLHWRASRQAPRVTFDGGAVAAGQLLADLGADVVKVEMPGVGDYSRWVPATDPDRRPPFFL